MPQKYFHGLGDARWIRHDAHLWIQPNIERWMKPGVDPADVIPALAEKRAQEEAARERAQAAEDAAFDAFIERERRLLAAMREELNEIKAELARRRRLWEQTKYSPSQPRVPRGDSRGGQWTDGSTGGSIARPVGNTDVDDVSESSELGDLFRIKPDETHVEGVQVGGDVIRVCIASGISSGIEQGIKKYTITYDCAGGQSFKRSYIGNYRGIVPDPFR